MDRLPVQLPVRPEAQEPGDLAEGKKTEGIRQRYQLQGQALRQGQGDTEKERIILTYISGWNIEQRLRSECDCDQVRYEQICEYLQHEHTDVKSDI